MVVDLRQNAVFLLKGDCGESKYRRAAARFRHEVKIIDVFS